ncbi:hypothetical protein KP509_02G020700 [Ceratopteris richardii]|uniref:Uncharacterized protein n=1 Tax=Ceratopteris richardii TaxID=49495 RepID=A0A8T2VBH7_CERRI|nr:hypothetical protein KP509_02G020700 [Ceratopteris richardii]
MSDDYLNSPLSLPAPPETLPSSLVRSQSRRARNGTSCSNLQLNATDRERFAIDRDGSQSSATDREHATDTFHWTIARQTPQSLLNNRATDTFLLLWEDHPLTSSHA